VAVIVKFGEVIISVLIYRPSYPSAYNVRGIFLVLIEASVQFFRTMLWRVRVEY